MIPNNICPGERVKASAYFVNPDGSQIQPADPYLYPVWRIIDHVGDIVISGIGTYNDKSRCYEAEFMMPDYVELSASYTNPSVDTSNQDNRPYMIEWEVVDIRNNSHTCRETFFVSNPLFTMEVKEQQKITIPMASLPLSIPVVRNLSVDTQLIFQVYNLSSNGSSTTATWSALPQRNGSYGEYYIYSVEIPPNTLTENEEYLGVWQFSDSPLGGRIQKRINPTDDKVCTTTYVDTTSGTPDGYPVTSTSRTVFTQVILCANLLIMKLLSDLRMYLDKVAKNLDIYTGYRDSELYFHLKRGAEYLNSFGLLSQWTLIDWMQNPMLKGGLYWLLEGAKYSALRSQYLAEGDSTFDFSSTPVSLSVSREGFIESELSRIQDGLANQFTQTKNQLIKSQKSVGYLGLQFPGVSPTMYMNRAFLGFSWPLPLNSMGLAF